eukprot:COSAG01_NODE_103_length_26263_cov_31.957728_1_plen_79_part_00
MELLRRNHMHDRVVESIGDLADAACCCWWIMMDRRRRRGAAVLTLYRTSVSSSRSGVIRPGPPPLRVAPELGFVTLEC